MIYRGHVIDKMANVYKRTFPVRLKKNKFITLLRVNYYWYLNVLIDDVDKEISLQQGNVYFKVIGQSFHKLWQFKTRLANVRNLCAVLIRTFCSRSSFLDYASSRVKFKVCYHGHYLMALTEILNP